MMEDLNLGTVDMIANYDDTRTEPTVLPGKFPMIAARSATSSGSYLAFQSATNFSTHLQARRSE